MDTMNGRTLINRKGKIVEADAVLRDKRLFLYYFSASWVPADEPFLLKLKDLYKTATRLNYRLEVIFISSDHDQVQMMAHFVEKHGDWLAAPYGDYDEELRRKFGITGLPMLIVVSNDGKVITQNGKHELDKLGVNVLITWT